MTEEGSERRVSVVIPSFNASAFVADAIDSVLAQRGDALLEVIVLDDGSTDGTAVAVRQYESVRYQRQEHLGAAQARNAGVALASGALLAFLDADDVWEPDKLALQTRVLDSHPHVGMVFCHMAEFVDASVPRRGRGERTRTELRRGYLPSTMLVRRADFLRVGLFDCSLRVGEFIDWHARAVEAGLSSFVLPEMLVRRRLHDANTGIRERDHRSDYARLLKAALDRRRR